MQEPQLSFMEKFTNMLKGILRIVVIVGLIYVMGKAFI